MNPLRTGLLQCCPACGKGKLFAGMLTVAPECAHCRFPLREHDTGDGPAFFVITVLGGLVTALAAAVEIHYAPPLWLHGMLWIPLIGVGSVLLLRLFKSILIAYQYHHKLLRDPSR